MRIRAANFRAIILLTILAALNGCNEQQASQNKAGAETKTQGMQLSNAKKITVWVVRTQKKQIIEQPHTATHQPGIKNIRHSL